jgi:hypothetical protein
MTAFRSASPFNLIFLRKCFIQTEMQQLDMALFSQFNPIEESYFPTMGSYLGNFSPTAPRNFE